MTDIFLFDMDGTLTEPREQISDTTVQTLLSVCHAGHEVGIVTGSPMNYLEEQLAPLLYELRNDARECEHMFHFLPCNGTQYSILDARVMETVFEGNMRKEVGSDHFNELMLALVRLQNEVSALMVASGMPLTGNFIQYRDSMINWCPIGRNAASAGRTRFVDFDQIHDFREKYHKILETWLTYAGMSDIITIAMGGSTSFDIYPTGWDKTYALRWFKDCDCYFIGDRCQPGGNDYHLFKKLNERGEFAFETDSPSMTEQKVEEILSALSSVG